MNTPVIVKMPGLLTPGVDDAESPMGSFDVILSTPGLDRDGDQLLANEWKMPLPARITFDVDHGMSVEKTIGSGVPFINADGNLQVKGTYASTGLAQMTRTLVGEGHIFATSVTFLQADGKGADGKAVTTRELLNGAFVSIPANPEAIVLASKALETKVSKAASLQQIHDLSVASGAECKHVTTSSGKDVTDPETKAAAPAPAMSPAEVDALLVAARARADTSDLL